MYTAISVWKKKSNPSLQMIKKITSIFPAIKLEMLF